MIQNNKLFKAVALGAAAAFTASAASSVMAYEVNVVNGDMNTWSLGVIPDAGDSYPVNNAGQDGWRAWADNTNSPNLRLWNPGTIDRSNPQRNAFYDVGWNGLDGEGLASGYVIVVRTQGWDYRNASSIGATTNLAQRWKDDWNNRIWTQADGGDIVGSAAGAPRAEWRFDDGGTPTSGTGVVGDGYAYPTSSYLQTDVNGDYTGWTGTASRTYEAAAQILTEEFDSTARYTLSARVGRLAEGDGTAAHNGSSLNAGAHTASGNNSSRFFNDAPALWGGYNVQLMAGDAGELSGSNFAGGVYGNPTLIGEDGNTLALAQNTWGDSTVAYTPTPGTQAAMDAIAGTNLLIRLGAFETTGAHQNTNHAAFDNVVLTKIMAGDANEDDLVNGADANVWRANNGSTGDWNSADFTGEGNVSAADLALWRGNFGVVNGAVLPLAITPSTFSAVSTADRALGDNIADFFYDPITGELSVNTDGESVWSMNFATDQDALTANLPSLDWGFADFGSALEWTDLTAGDQPLNGPFVLGTLATGLTAGDFGAVTYFTTADASTNVGSVTVSAIPEPASLVFLGVGSLLLVKRRQAA